MISLICGKHARGYSRTGYRLKEAAQEVAKTLGGDVEKTEEELLELLVRTKEDEQDVDGLSAKNVVPDEEMNVSESDEKRVNIRYEYFFFTIIAY